MEDWRLLVNQDDLKGKELYKITFPEFWERSYMRKNAFFQMIKEDAENFVKTYHRGESYLIGNKIGEFWHTHCEFCTQKIDVSSKCICYSTKDFSSWICSDCYCDFCDNFSWSVKNPEDDNL